MSILPGPPAPRPLTTPSSCLFEGFWGSCYSEQNKQEEILKQNQLVSGLMPQSEEVLVGRAGSSVMRGPCVAVSQGGHPPSEHNWDIHPSGTRLSPPGGGSKLGRWHPQGLGEKKQGEGIIDGEECAAGKGLKCGGRELTSRGALPCDRG